MKLLYVARPVPRALRVPEKASLGKRCCRRRCVDTQKREPAARSGAKGRSVMPEAPSASARLRASCALRLRSPRPLLRLALLVVLLIAVRSVPIDLCEPDRLIVEVATPPC